MCSLRRSRDRRTQRRPTVAALALALFFLLLLAQASARPLVREGVSITRGGHSGGRAASGSSSSSSSGAARRRLVGPGSAPPSCRSRCGSCSPCKPVHVPVRPGLSAPLEYYPEAWRCGCGNKLFMP